MSSVQDLYRAKLRNPADAVAAIPNGSRLAMGMATAEPPALLGALAERARADAALDLRLYYFEAMSTAGDTVLAYDLRDRIRPFCMFMTGVDRRLVKEGVADSGTKFLNYVPNNFHQSPRLMVEEARVDTFVCTVSPMDRHGFMSFGTGNDYSTAVARAAKRLIVEVNPHMPRVFGSGSALHVSEVTAVVEHEAPLLELLVRAGSDEDRTIARTVAGMVPDGACLQMGVGALPNLVCAELGGRNDLGIHSEVMSPGMVDLIRCGRVTNRAKALNRGKSVFTFAMGQKAMYDFIDDNPSVESWPVDYVNDPSNIARNDGVVSINGTIEIDLTGACNSEHMLGHQYSASGGQLDFVRGAYASRGGKSIIAASSTAAKGKVSRIVPRLSGPVTTPRIDTHWIVTEHGAADMKGRSSTERAHALIAIAHPDFRDGLAEAARAMHLI
ncbi:acetyl-CoA hydrolase/transferase family protein [Lichenibacterium minor]|uniref:Acetyl-CoA hydrolase/transferase family protein n=1 Tax=Lichenibacterium minor TaxID=2316528 RepID=A0A4Q2TYD3_9HYPH|nr:acetyl-CoA hydrolase/transferase C-terminal domain-containing protein [Lichenibacterium minor]RYC29122.1 acetyl-CoA hydrolase/transferase family protein [Lichenibacterium minor]